MSQAPVIRYLSPAQTARALGVTVRALRVYEQRGLVRPLRSQAGWRAYGPEALARLHQVLTLKRLGLSLAKIAVLISGRLSKLDAVLELQEEVLERRRREAGRGLELVRAARARIAGGQALSLDDLTTLTRETTMTDQAPDWAKKMQPMIDRNLSAEDKAAIASRAGDYDQAQVSAQWEALIAEAKPLVGTDPGAPQAQDLARRWKAMVHKATGGDPEVTARMGRVWQDSFADPKVAPILPFGPEVMAFVSQAMARATPRG
jgi:MerR family transcriptional regulator, thiopeptide resistance regulator